MTIVNTELAPAPSNCRLPDTYRRVLRARRRPQAGQSVLIVLGVLFLVAFLGALFVLVVIRNLENAQRQNQVLTADYYAQAGVNYANSMLQTNPLGADWRPPLQFGTNNVDVPGYSGTLAAAPINDPDKKWLDQGYSRYNLANGRFLLRVTYNPASASIGAGSATAPLAPTAKYLRIDVVGRQGTVDSSDPTTYTNSPAESLRAERVAYKPIGLVDYARFITNKDNTSQTATLGVPSGYDSTNGITTPGVMDISAVTAASGTAPEELTLKPYPITTTFGSAGAYANAAATSYAGGGSVRCNGNLRLYGNNQLYLAGQFGDDWDIAGNLTFDQYMPGTATAARMQATQATLIGTAYDGTPYTASPLAPSVFPSNDTTNFITFNGLIRDGNSGNDQKGYPRSVGRLNPPLIDATDPVTNLTRYQVETKQPANTFFTAGVPATIPLPAASPATIYINNAGDIQTETQSTSNPQTLREEWLQTDGNHNHWNPGNFYSPPGVLITFGAITVPTTGAPVDSWGITLSRTDKDALGNAIVWPGTSSPTVRLIYNALPAGFTQDLNNPIFSLNVNATPTTTLPNDNDVIIYADGNVRVRGIVSDPNPLTPGGTLTSQHVTIVTNGVGYVEGSILRGVEANAGAMPPQAGASIGLLATQYICLNTTQFTIGAPEDTGSEQPQTQPTGDPNNNFLDFTQGATLTTSAILPTVYLNGPNSTEHLYVSEQAQESANSVPTTTGDYSMMSGTLLTNGSFAAAQTSTPIRTTEALPITAFAATTDATFALTFNTDKSLLTSSLNDWMMERAAVLPADVKIEAVLYAQNNSFFVIPGEWFNSETGDTFFQTTNAGNTIYTTTRPGSTADPLFPYHGQPIDLQITIQGSISENMTADIADQAAWMQKWGWIPRYHGSVVGTDGTVANGADEPPTAHQSTTGSPATPTVGIGLNFVYDPLNGFPVINPGAVLPAVPTYLRQDQYGRPLPSVPALPVSPDLLYNGQPTS